jgi:hypothetical protein
MAVADGSTNKPVAQAISVRAETASPPAQAIVPSPINAPAMAITASNAASMEIVLTTLVSVLVPGELTVAAEAACVTTNARAAKKSVMAARPNPAKPMEMVAATGQMGALAVQATLVQAETASQRVQATALSPVRAVAMAAHASNAASMALA